MDVDQLREYIQSYNLNNCALGSQGYTRILLQLFGFLGHGKSSLINSCKYVLHDKPFTVHAEAAPADGGLTMERKSYPLTNCIMMVDNRGCSTMNSFETGEIYAQLCNFIPLDQRVEWTKEYVEMLGRLEDGDVEPNFTDIIVPIFVYSATKEMAEREADEMKTFLRHCRELTGMFPIIVLTHKTSGPFSKLRDMFEGMGAEEIFALENYTAEDHKKTRGRHLQFLNLIHKVLLNVNFMLEEERNPRRERSEQKKFLYRFLHEREVKQQ